MREMVDWVAQAIEDAEAGGNYTYREVARAAMETMRKPTEAMLDAGYEVDEMVPYGYGVMIDAALKP
jgi:hypothetical protein